MRCSSPCPRSPSNRSEVLSDPALEARAREIGQALRCVVCQNQSIDDSAAEVAHDMRRAVRERLTAGDSNDQVFAYMVARYGDYVLLKPPFKTGTLVLWLGAPLLLLIAGGALLLAARRRQRAGLAAPPPLSDEEQRRLDALLGPLMLEFLLALLATVTVGVLLIPLLRAKQETTGRLDGELAIYRDQLAEIERERAAGTLPESEAAAARIEVERRILAAGDHAPRRTRAQADATLHKFLPPALALVIPLLALGLYLQTGRPGLPAAPFAAGRQPPAATDEPLSVEKLLAAARARLAAQPDDPEALSALGEALTLEADGTVTRPAVDAFSKALAAINGRPTIRAPSIISACTRRRAATAAPPWHAGASFWPRAHPDAPFLPMLRAEIERVAKAAGLDPDLPPPPATGMPPHRCQPPRASSRRRWPR